MAGELLIVSLHGKELYKLTTNGYRSITNDNLKMVCDYLKRYGIDTLKELQYVLLEIL